MIWQCVIPHGMTEVPPCLVCMTPSDYISRHQGQQYLTPMVGIKVPLLSGIGHMAVADLYRILKGGSSMQLFKADVAHLLEGLGTCPRSSPRKFLDI